MAVAVEGGRSFERTAGEEEEQQEGRSAAIGGSREDKERGGSCLVLVCNVYPCCACPRAAAAGLKEDA